MGKYRQLHEEEFEKFDFNEEDIKFDDDDLPYIDEDSEYEDSEYDDLRDEEVEYLEEIEDTYVEPDFDY
jgi:hypothetical protein